MGEITEEYEILECLSISFDHNREPLEIEQGINLVGTMFADEEPKGGAVILALQGIWQNLGQIRITKARGKVYTITVGNEKQAYRLIEGSPWMVKNHCFTVRYWPLYRSIDDILPHRVVLWVQAHDIPHHDIKTANGKQLGALIGTVLEVEDPDEVGNRGFIRMRIDIDENKPLPTGCWLPRQTKMHNLETNQRLCRQECAWTTPVAETRSKVRLKFEGLKCFCYHYGRLGHTEIACRYTVHPKILEQGVHYGAHLIATTIQQPSYTLPQHPMFYKLPVTAPVANGQ